MALVNYEQDGAGGDTHPEPPRETQCLQRRAGRRAGRCAASLRHRRDGAHRHPVRHRPRLLERRRRAAAPAAQPRGVPQARRAAGPRHAFVRPADQGGELEAGDRRGARLCARPVGRHRARMRPDRRRGGHAVPDHRDLARPGRRQVLGADALSRRRRVHDGGGADRPLLHRRGGVQGQPDQSRGAQGQVSRGGARAGRRGAQEPAAQRALDRAHAALLHGSPQPRGDVHGRAGEALSLRGFRRGRARLRREAQAAPSSRDADHATQHRSPS